MGKIARLITPVTRDCSEIAYLARKPEIRVEAEYPLRDDLLFELELDAVMAEKEAVEELWLEKSEELGE